MNNISLHVKEISIDLFLYPITYFYINNTLFINLYMESYFTCQFNHSE